MDVFQFSAAIFQLGDGDGVGKDECAPAGGGVARDGWRAVGTGAGGAKGEHGAVRHRL